MPSLKKIEKGAEFVIKVFMDMAVFSVRRRASRNKTPFSKISLTEEQVT
jgi:hypothetical protein